MALYFINDGYYRQFLTTKVKDDSNKGKNVGGAQQKATEKRNMVRDDWDEAIWKMVDPG